MNVQTEQRHYLRYQIFDYTAVLVPGVVEPISAMLVDIGLGGAQLRSQVRFPDETHITMRLANEEGELIELRGEVRHCTEMGESGLFGSGIRFLPQDHSERMALASFVHGVFKRQRDRLVS